MARQPGVMRRASLSRFIAVAVMLFLIAPLWAAPAAAPASGKPAIQRIVFLGNSITRHGPKADIGWTGNWGMAATAMEKDYAHVLVGAIAAQQDKSPEMLLENISDFERKPDAFDFKARLEKAIAFRPQIIVLAIGENVPGLHTDAAKAAFRENVLKLLAALKPADARENVALFVRSSFWPDAAKDSILKAAALEAGATFVDITAIGKDPANRASAERKIDHAGVAAHPGDKGMKAIADALLKAIIERQALDKTSK